MPAVDYNLMGMGGGVVLGAGDSLATSAPGAKCKWLVVVNDTQLAAFGAPLNEGGRLVDPGELCTPITLPAGLGIPGIFTTCEVTTGVVICVFI